jgi:hypothetical protein
MAPFDPDLVPLEHADLFYHGMPDEDGNPVGLSDEEYDAEKARKIADGTWPFAPQPEEAS